MSVTIKDIARVAGVSYSTVSKALNDSPLVKEDTKARILQVTEMLGYQPNMAAKSLVSKKSNIIGIIWPSVQLNSLSALLASINNELNANSYNMLVSISPIESAINTFNRFRADGIIAFRGFNQPDYETSRTKSSIPLLYYGESNDREFPTVTVDRERAITMAVSHLAQLHHRKIVFIGSLAHTEINQKKIRGFKDGLQLSGIPFEPDMLVNTDGYGWLEGFIAAKELLKKPERPTAIITGAYDLAVGVIRAVREEGLSIPGDISVISYDNIPEMELLEVPLTAVGPPVEKIAKTIVELLFLHMEDPKSSIRSVVIESDLVERNSCAPPQTSTAGC